MKMEGNLQWTVTISATVGQFSILVLKICLLQERCGRELLEIKSAQMLVILKAVTPKVPAATALGTAGIRMFLRTITMRCLERSGTSFRSIAGNGAQFVARSPGTGSDSGEPAQEGPILRVLRVEDGALGGEHHEARLRQVLVRVGPRGVGEHEYHR